MRRATLLIATLAVLMTISYVGWSLSDTVPAAFAHTASDSNREASWAMRAPWGIPFIVTIDTSGSTHEYRSESVMVMDYHSNTINIPNGKCGSNNQYPMCFDLNNPRAVYSHPNNSYTLSSSHWETFWCIGESNDAGKCWNSDTELGWLTIPVDAEIKRAITIKTQSEQQGYVWLSCVCGGKSLSDEYEID